MKMTSKRMLILLICGGMLLSGTACGAVGAPTAEVSVLKVEKKNLEPTVGIEGVLIPASTALVSSRISGQIESVSAAPGEAVTAGQVLVTLDRRALTAQVSQAQAGLQTAQAGVRLNGGQAEAAKVTLDAARTDFDRVQSLAQSGAASQSQLDAAQDKLRTAQVQYENVTGPSKAQADAAVATAEAALRNLQVQLDYTQLGSPIDGIVTDQRAVVGETVSVGTGLVTVADTKTLKLKGKVSQELLPLLKLGQEVPVTVNAFGDRRFKGILTGIGPTALDTGELFPVEITLTNDGTLLAGMTASADLRTLKLSGIAVPEAAIVKASGKSYVFLIQNGTAVRQEVVTGVSTQGETEVRQGLQEGDTIAVTGAASLHEGMSVAVINGD